MEPQYDLAQLEGDPKKPAQAELPTGPDPSTGVKVTVNASTGETNVEAGGNANPDLVKKVQNSIQSKSGDVLKAMKTSDTHKKMEEDLKEEVQKKAKEAAETKEKEAQQKKDVEQAKEEAKKTVAATKAKLEEKEKMIKEKEG